ncbi:MAG: manganese catalase family protein [Clostridiales bacterium]|nr:manganese catalase family protein [Clostridiales bacterium]
MWIYEKKLQYPVKIKNKNPKIAKYIISQFGGPDGELGASLRYLSQRYSMPDGVSKGVLTDVGTEELAHLEIVGTIIHQLVDGVSPKILEQEGLGAYYTDHGLGVYPQAASGVPFDAIALGVKGDPIVDLTENLAAEEKARITYEHLINICDDPDVVDPLKFLRQREIVHFQRFGETLQRVQSKLEEKKFFMFKNPCCSSM